MPEPPISEHRRQRREAERLRRAHLRRRLTLAGAIGVAAVIAFLALHSGGSSKHAVSSASGGGSKRAPPARDSGPQMSADQARQAKVPILMYHSISVPPPGAALPELFVPTKDFTEQMQWLKDQGEVAVTLDQVYSAWHGKGSLPEHPIVLSFDDGYLTQYTHAVPVLEKLGWPGVLNLKLLSLEQGEMTDKMIRTMIGDGWEIDSHTINHLDVSQLSGAQLRHEVADSRTMLQQRFDIPVNSFCYPAGAHDAESVAAVRSAGYLDATTVQTGVASPDGDPFTLPRIRIDGSDGLAGFEKKLDRL